MPASSVPGHGGFFCQTRLHKRPVLFLAGRVHLYEGYSAQQVVYYVKLLHYLGVKVLVITNSAGSVNPSIKPGSLMLITDFINLMWQNPLRGKVTLPGRLTGICSGSCLDPVLKELALKVAREKRIQIKSGLYAGLLGPCYETPAEIRMLRMLGADAVGMSTVPEIVCASALGLKVLAISSITNMAAGLTTRGLSHQEVIDMGRKISHVLFSFIWDLVSVCQSVLPGCSPYGEC
jgi:purine-nucleoside phosphorylase